MATMTSPSDSRADAQAEAEMDEAIAEVEAQLGVIFSRIRLSWKDAALQIHPDLQPVGYKILGAVVRAGEANAHALADLLDLDKSVVSRQVRMLEDVGLLVSRADERDGRARVLSPTPTAVERVNVVRIQNQNRLRDLLRSRQLGELQVFAEMLRLLSEV
jgi:DNA-binding MarR family transcriptional regulator